MEKSIEKDVNQKDLFTTKELSLNEKAKKDLEDSKEEKKDKEKKINEHGTNESNHFIQNSFNQNINQISEEKNKEIEIEINKEDNRLNSEIVEDSQIINKDSEKNKIEFCEDKKEEEIINIDLPLPSNNDNKMDLNIIPKEIVSEKNLDNEIINSENETWRPPRSACDRA